MRFHLIDRIDSCEPGKALKAAKLLARGEEYLADHFPKFPVMPGVLMLESLVEAAAWLWRVSSNYEHPVIVLRDVSMVKYGKFMEPGRVMTVTVDLVKVDGTMAAFKGKGVNDAGETTANAAFTLHGYSLPDDAANKELQAHWRKRWNLLTGAMKTR